MYAKSGGLQGFSGLFTSANSTAAEPMRKIDKKLNDEVEGGPPNQDDLREAMNLAYKASIKRARVIDQIGGEVITTKPVKQAKLKSVVKKKVQKKVGPSKQWNKKKDTVLTRW